MGDSIAELERLFEADPENPQLASQVMAARTRALWTFKNKTLQEWTVELQSESWERVTEALSALSELGLLCVDLWPQITQSITDTEAAEPDGSPGYFTAKIASFLACLSKGFTDRQETLCEWLGQFQDSKADKAIRGNIAALALCEIAQCSPMSPKALLDAQFWVLKYERSPQYALNEGLRRLFIAKGKDPKFQKEVQEHLEHPEKQISKFQSRTWAQWSEELRSGDNDLVLSALDQLHWASFYGKRLWPDLLTALDRAFDENSQRFHDLATFPEYFEWFSSLIADDTEKIQAVRRWLDQYSSKTKEFSQIAILALGSLTLLSANDSSLRAPIIAAFERSGEPEIGDTAFQEAYYDSVPKLLPEAQSTLPAVLEASNKISQFEYIPGEFATSALAAFELSDQQFWDLLTLSIHCDYTHGKDTANSAARKQIERDPSRLTRLPTILTKYYGAGDYDLVLKELKALEHHWPAAPLSDFLELYAKGLASEFELNGDDQGSICQGLKKRLESFSSLKEIQGFTENTELSPSQREAAFILSLVFVDDEAERLQRAESIPEELQGQLWRKVLESLKN